jgi:enamine deaminase RidA (YjgF/YER057c/UK114 family)/ubiquinone/menaquinone biosynthesis C-methylase UbiE
VELDPAIRAYYDKGNEAARLGSGPGRLEYVRTTEIIERSLSGDALEILDVGGGPGIYAAWLKQAGHRVHVVDPVPLHVEQALAEGLEAEVGDARRLHRGDASVDVVLLLGPLYHLHDAHDRGRALDECMRVVRPGGLLFAAGISRHAAMLDLLVNLDKLHHPGVFEVVRESVLTGVFRGPGEGKLFTTAYFHVPGGLREEIASVGFEEVRVFHVEGPGFLAPDLEARLDDPPRRQALLDAVRLVEEDEHMLATSHLLGVARKPSWPTETGSLDAAHQISEKAAPVRKRVSSDSSYESRIGFSRAVRVEDRVLVSGTAPIWPDGSCDADPYIQAKRCLEIIAQALAEVGGDRRQVVRTRMFITDAAVADEVGRAHGEFFSDIRPAATMVVVTGLLDDRWKVEIEAEAHL